VVSFPRVKYLSWLLELRIFRLSLLQNGNVRIGVFPEREQILIDDTTGTANNEEGRRLMAESELEETGRASPSNQHEWRSSYVESEVLVKTPAGWKLVGGRPQSLVISFPR
jgi:hypothetical protein